MLSVGRYGKMNKLKITSLLFVTITVLAVLFTSCNSTSALLSNNPAKADTSIDDYEARLDELESRIGELEQVLEAVIEYNIVKSALIQMLQENGYIDCGSIAGIGYSSSWAPTNDMRLFPSPTHPLYGFDKDGDGIPDTNYVPFETSKWYYNYENDLEIEQFPDMGWSQLPKRPTLEELQNQPEPDPYETELHNVETAVLAAMVDAGVTSITAGNLSATQDLTIGTTTVGSYISGGVASLICSYSIAADGTVTQVWTPDIP